MPIPMGDRVSWDWTADGEPTPSRRPILAEDRATRPSAQAVPVGWRSEGTTAMRRLPMGVRVLAVTALVMLAVATTLHLAATPAAARQAPAVVTVHVETSPRCSLAPGSRHHPGGSSLPLRGRPNHHLPELIGGGAHGVAAAQLDAWPMDVHRAFGPKCGERLCPLATARARRPAVATRRAPPHGLVHATGKLHRVSGRPSARGAPGGRRDPGVVRRAGWGVSMPDHHPGHRLYPAR